MFWRVQEVQESCGALDANADRDYDAVMKVVMTAYEVVQEAYIKTRKTPRECRSLPSKESLKKFQDPDPDLDHHQNNHFLLGRSPTYPENFSQIRSKLQ